MQQATAETSDLVTKSHVCTNCQRKGWFRCRSDISPDFEVACGNCALLFKVADAVTEQPVC